MATFDEFLAANEQYAAMFDKEWLAILPRRRVVILTCMDARLDPKTFLGLDLGDAHIIRNAGGRASDDAVRSLVISQRLLGTNEIVVIHHTDCGMLSFTNEELAAKIRDDLGVDVSGRDFLPFTDLEESVVEDVTTLRQSSLIPQSVSIIGAIYEVKTGHLREIIRK